MKTLIVNLLFFCFAGMTYGQTTVKPTTKSTPKKPKIHKSIFFVQVRGVRHQYAYQNQNTLNVRLTQISEAKFRYDSLTTNNELVYSVVCQPVISEHLFTIATDSFVHIPRGTETTPTDSIVPKETYTYSISLIKNGRYEEFNGDGVRIVIGSYKFGQKHGKWKYFDETGKMFDKERWKLGIKQ